MATDPAVMQMVYNQVMKSIASQTVTPALIITCTVVAMQAVETQGQLTGEQKKQIVLSVLQMVVTNAPGLDQDTRTALSLLVATAVPMTIDKMIGVANGDIAIGGNNSTCKCL